MNILLVSHGELCTGVLDAYQMLVAESSNVHAVSLTDTGIDDFRTRLNEKIDELLRQGPLLILADLIGGTPYNECYARFLTSPNEIRLVTGLNLPMLIETGMEAQTSSDLEALYQTAISAGTAGVGGTSLPEDDLSGQDDDLF